MSNLLESSSIQLSQILNNIIETQDAIKSRRMRVDKLTSSDKWVTRYTIGSQCDGLELKGVDIDYMYINKHLPVIDILSGDGSDITPPPSYLLACCSPSSSAYMCIEMHIRLRDMLNSRQYVINVVCDSAIYYMGSLFVSSSLFLQHNSRVKGGNLIGRSMLKILCPG